MNIILEQMRKCEPIIIIHCLKQFSSATCLCVCFLEILEQPLANLLLWHSSQSQSNVNWFRQDLTPDNGLSKKAPSIPAATVQTFSVYVMDAK